MESDLLMKLDIEMVESALDVDLIYRQRIALHKGCKNNKDDFCVLYERFTHELNCACDEKKFSKSVDS